MKGEIFGLKGQLESLTAERNLLEEALRKIQVCLPFPSFYIIALELWLALLYLNRCERQVVGRVGNRIDYFPSS